MSDKNSPISNDDKKRFIDDLKKTINQFPILIRSLFWSIIWLIDKKYDNLPPKQKQQLKKTLDDIKNTSNKWIWWIKTFANNIKDIVNINKTNNKEPEENKKEEIKQKSDQKTLDDL
jgi:hypothetical protein